MARQAKQAGETEVLACGISVTDYLAWLNSPVTRAIYRHMEERYARPQPVPNNASPEEYQYRLGFVTGFWSALDLPRNLIPPAAMNESEATYIN